MYILEILKAFYTLFLKERISKNRPGLSGTKRRSPQPVSIKTTMARACGFCL